MPPIQVYVMSRAHSLHSRLRISFLHIVRVALLDLVLHRMRAIGLVFIRLGLGIRAQIVGVLLYVS